MAHFKLEKQGENLQVELDGSGAEIISMLCTAYANRNEIKDLVELSLKTFEIYKGKIKEKSAEQ